MFKFLQIAAYKYIDILLELDCARAVGAGLCMLESIPQRFRVNQRISFSERTTNRITTGLTEKDDLLSETLVKHGGGEWRCFCGLR